MATFNIEELVRPHLRDLKPYSSARDEFSGKAEIYLDANENPLGSTINESVNRYPDPHQHKLKIRLGQLKQLATENIFIGNGSDEAIDLLIRAFCEPAKDHIVICPPTYGMYKVSAEINNVGIIEVPLMPDFRLDVERLIHSIEQQCKLLFLCSPNNPTGNLLEKDKLIYILEHFAGLVIVDEAYIDFASTHSLLPLIKEYQHLVILQTFSKAWGMAGLRAGMAYAHPSIINILNKIKPPYNVNAITQEKCLEALEKLEVFDSMITELLKEREALQISLESLNSVLHIHPSEANFLLVRFKNAVEIYQYLVEKKIIVRDRSNILYGEGCLRISVGSKYENRQLIEALTHWESV